MNNVLKNLLTIVALSLFLATASVAVQGQEANSTRVELTPAELAWLATHKSIRVGMAPVFPPLKFVEKDEIKGVEPDYLQLLSAYTGIKFELITANFPEMDAKVKTGEIDMFLSFNIPERLEYMTFTVPFMGFKQVIVTRNDAPFVSGIGGLKGKRIATVKGVKLYDKLLGPYPDIVRVPVDTMEQMFKAVDEAKADALISKNLFAGYLIHNYPNLKIAGITDLPPEPYLYAVRKDYPELVSILNKAISAIPDERREAIIQKWLNVHIEYLPNWHEIQEWTLVSVGTFSLILALTLYWNRKLRLEIARRQGVEITLRESKEQLKTILEASEAGIIQVSSSGVIVFANRRMAAMFGMTVAELLGTPYPDLLPAAEKEVCAELMHQLIKGEILSIALDRHYLRADGTGFCGHLSGRRLENPDGSLRALVGVIVDVTEQKQFEKDRQNLERKMFHAQKIESLGVLAGGIAHDFNNILTAIVGNAELALMRINKDSPAVDHLDRIKQAAGRAADLAKQMLAYSGKGKFVVERIDLNLLLEEMLHLIGVSISRKVVLRLNPYLPLPLVEVDATQLRQIVMNLILNASEAIGDNRGMITITTGCMECDRSHLNDAWLDDSLSDGLYVSLEITDNGCGMGKETLAKLFDPFFSTKFTGRGLGMAAVLGIVRGHKGAIKVESELNKGTTFKILLPASDMPAV